MNVFNPTDNADRLKRGLLSLISGIAIEFSKTNSSLIVVFDGKATTFSSGRVLLFQQYIYERTGIIPEIIRQVPACIKIFFNIDADNKEQRELISQTLETSEFRELCNKLRISQVQRGSKIIHINEK